MRRSFGSGSGGLQMWKTVRRGVRTVGTGGNSNTTANRKTKRKPTISANKINISSVAPLNLPVSAAAAPALPDCSSTTYNDDSDWECIDGSDDDRAQTLFDDFVFGSVPSVDEVQHAVHSLHEFIEPFPPPYLMKDEYADALDRDKSDKESSLTGFLHRTPSYGAELDWIEPSLHLCNSSALQPYRSGVVFDAFHLLQNEPSVKRMVMSLSSDRAVWDAVLNNEVVREIRDSLNQEDDIFSVGSDEISVSSDSSEDILSWIVNNVKAKIVVLIKNISKAVNELFSHQRNDKVAERNAVALEEKLKTSFMLSVVVLLIVLLNRANKV